jgi:hypothetical protein
MQRHAPQLFEIQRCMTFCLYTSYQSNSTSLSSITPYCVELLIPMSLEVMQFKFNAQSIQMVSVLTHFQIFQLNQLSNVSTA